LELEHFFEGVQTLAMRVERTQVKVEQLVAKAATRRTRQ